jgi:hypothetical protein
MSNNQSVTPRDVEVAGYSGVISGFSMFKDPETGFLEFHDKFGKVQEVDELAMERPWLVPDSAFSVSKKLAFLKAYAEHFPNLWKSAQQAKTTTGSVRSHLKIDGAFRKAFEDVMEEMRGRTLDRFDSMGNNERNFMDRIVVAKTMFPETFDPAKRVILEHATPSTPDEARARLMNVSDAIDADVVSAQFEPKHLNPGTPDQMTDKSA